MILFVTGISTGVGKTIVTGIVARELNKINPTITMKIVQTGCNKKISSDIKIHRKIMGIQLLEEDYNGITCPYIFKFPSSPHLAAKLENKEVSIDRINDSIQYLSSKFNNLLIEGAGGIYVPLNEKLTILDWLEKVKLPVVLVTTPVLGSINHSLLTIETLLLKNIQIFRIYYNVYFKENEKIKEDTFNYLSNRYKNIEIIKLNKINFY